MPQHPGSPEIRQKSDRAQALLQQGKTAEAEALYREILNNAPEDFGSLYRLGHILWQRGKLESALSFFERAACVAPGLASFHADFGVLLEMSGRSQMALLQLERSLSLDSRAPGVWSNQAYVLERLGRFDEALESCDRAIALLPGNADAWINRGNALQNLGRLDEALASYDRAISLDPGEAKAHYNRGNVLLELKRTDEAISSFERAIARLPAYPKALCRLGDALQSLKRPEEALASYDKALALDPAYADAWANRGNALLSLRRFTEALSSCDRAIMQNPGLAEAWANRGAILTHLDRLDEALRNCEKAIALQPDNAKAHCNLGTALLSMGRAEEALKSFDQALLLDPCLAEAHLGRASFFRDNQFPEEALASFGKALALDPGFDFLPGEYLYAGLKLCQWDALPEILPQYRQAIAHEDALTTPFFTLALLDDPALQQRAAARHAAIKYPTGDTPVPFPPRTPDGKIRIGYYSADFHEHVMGHLMAGLFEAHDTEQFECYGFSFGPGTGDAVQQRIIAAFGERFFDVREKEDGEVVALSRQLGIDIAIDLSGYTKGGRPRIFAGRAAPVQAAYLGYLGTTGADCFDYLFADKTVIPERDQDFYSEKIVYLPHCYQVNDDSLPISGRSFSRQEAGLPEKGFVFCCFNKPHKIQPATFDGWMRILKAVEESVLWLFDAHPTASANLRREAEARGVDASRLIFAARLPMDEYLARYRLADLFIDTLPYNALATASYALWAGLPVLTQRGKTFVGRGAASMLQAIGLPELVTETQEAFEATAIALAQNPERLRLLKEKLEQNRLTTPLFDTRGFARHIEAAYQTMFDRHQAGLPPEAFAVTDKARQGRHPSVHPAAEGANQ